MYIFFFNDTATTEIYTLSLHDALPIYLKDEAALENHLINVGVDGITVFCEKGPVTGSKLSNMILKMTALSKVLNHIEKRKRDRYIVEAIAKATEFKKRSLKSESEINNAIERIKSYVEKINGEEREITFTIERDEEHDCFKIVCVTITSGLSLKTVIDLGFMESPEFIEIQKLWQNLGYLGDPPYSIEVDGEKMEIGHYQSLVDMIMTHGKKGLYVQRYKGLGEMNPDQLWETTMDPETRTLRHVKVEDTVAADEMFTVLMGDQVEPRRNFIEVNALEVRNLDV